MGVVANEAEIPRPSQSLMACHTPTTGQTPSKEPFFLFTTRLESWCTEICQRSNRRPS
jgi:hypothetical protein